MQSNPKVQRPAVTRRSFLVAGMALAVTIAAGGCSALAEELAPTSERPVYRSQISAVEPLGDAGLHVTAARLQARLRFLADETSRVRPVRSEAGSWLLVEVPSPDQPQFGKLLLTKGRLSLMLVPAATPLDRPAPAGARVVVADLRVDNVSLVPHPSGTGEMLEFTLGELDAKSLAAATARTDQALAVVVDGTVRLAAEIQTAIPDGRVAIQSPARPAVLRSVGSLLRSGPLDSDLADDPNGQIGFAD